MKAIIERTKHMPWGIVYDVQSGGRGYQVCVSVSYDGTWHTPTVTVRCPKTYGGRRRVKGPKALWDVVMPSLLEEFSTKNK